MKTLAGLTLALALGLASSAHAATCTLNGSLKIQPMDSYFCDTTLAGSACDGWLVKDLNATTPRPMRYMEVQVYDLNWQFLARGATDANGNFTMSWTQASCTGQVWLWPSFTRRHENDLASPDPRFRFWISDKDGNGYLYAYPATLSGATTAWQLTWLRTPVEPGFLTKIANVYYTADQAFGEVVKWSTVLDTALAATYGSLVPRIMYDVEYEGGATNDNWGIVLAADGYNQSMGMRHELGHKVLWILHGWPPPNPCFTGRFGDTPDNHDAMSCEWGGVNMAESLASFFGIRSATTADREVWLCGWGILNEQNYCTVKAMASATLADPDRVIYGFFGVGDKYATTRNHCARVRSAVADPVEHQPGCRTCIDGTCTECPDTNADGVCDNFRDWGFRNEVDTVRFLWDMIDANNEGSEPTNESVASLMPLILTMPCSTAAFGDDGSCKENMQATAEECVPVSEIGGYLYAHRGSRDAYNPYDFAELIPGDQTGARNRNCVDKATD